MLDKNRLDPSKTQARFSKLSFGRKWSCFCRQCQWPAHRLNFQQREETPVWQRAISLNKQSRQGRPRSNLRTYLARRAPGFTAPATRLLSTPVKTRGPDIDISQTKERCGTTAQV